MEQFAEQCGMELIICDPSWGGRYGYVQGSGKGRIIAKGFKTRTGAYRNWYRKVFGPELGEGMYKAMRGK